MLSSLLIAILAPAEGESLEAQVRELFDDACVICHDAEDELNMEVEPGAYVGQDSVVNGKPFIVPGDPDASYFMDKMLPREGIPGDPMPPEELLSPEQLELVASWIRSLEPEEKPPVTANAGPEGQTTAAATGGKEPPKPEARPAEAKDRPPAAVIRHGRKPFHGTNQVTLPTTTTLGKRVLQYRIDHRFGRIGAERGAFGLDVGAVASFGLGYGILHGWDVLLRRTNSRKGYELGSKYVPVRQEAGRPLSFGLYGSAEYLRDFPASLSNPWSGNFMAMLSRLWWDRWSTMLTVGYHLRTNHNPRVLVDLGDGPEQVRDRRDTLTLGLASTVWVDAKRRWGIDVEWLLPVPDGGEPRNAFYYRGGDADPSGTMIGAWALGASYRIGRHFFQLFVTNSREIHTNLAAPGGQTHNPFPSGERPNFFLGFNLARTFKL